MKLLFDQNLSPDLVSLLDDLFPGSEHVFSLGMGETDDQLIAAYARQHQFVIVTKDRDYLMHSRGKLQAKVIWVVLNNCSTERVHQLLRRNALWIHEFGSDESIRLLPLP